MLSVQSAPQVSRGLRQPQHPFHVRHAPFEIQPFFISPVLPGETMKNLSLQSRVLTKPLKSPLIGWWAEHYIFYVKHRDLHSPDTFVNMAINNTAITSHEDYKTAATDAFYGFYGATGMDWVKACTRVVVETYFRDEGEAWDAVLIDGHPAAYINVDDMFQNAILESALDPAVDVSIPVDATPTPDTVSVRDIMDAVNTYNMLYQQGLVNVTYEDWLRSYGVRSQRAIVNKPELLRYTRTWTYPSAHVVPDATVAGDSDVTSAASWSIAERADKDRFFSEPGFIFGVTVIRPKIYYTIRKAPSVAVLNDAKSWLPAVLLGDPNASWKRITDVAADLIGGAASGDWWVDLKDLFLYGDQFSNVLTATDINGMGSGLGARLPTQAGVDALFVSGDGTAGVHQDGIVRLSVLSALSDTSPRGSSTAFVG